MVASVPGTQLLISLLPRLFPHASVAILGPTYGEYARSFDAAGRRVVEASTLDALADAPCAILCNPNNPDGRRFDAGTLLALARQRVGDGLLVVDEFFADLEGDGLSLASYLPLPGVLVLRSLSKSYGLGGVRLGFALADPNIAASIRAALGPWPVSGPAVEIGSLALADRAWREAAKQRLAQDVTRLDGMLREAGMTVIGGTLLFRLGESHEGRTTVFQRLGEAWHSRARLRLSPRLAPLRHPWRRGGVAAAFCRALHHLGRHRAGNSRTVQLRLTMAFY